MKESDIQNAIIEALVFDGWLVLRINQGARHGNSCPICDGTGLLPPNGVLCYQCRGMKVVKPRYIRFAFYQALGIEPTDKGISDVLAVKAGLDINRDMRFMDGHVGPLFLAIEVKATGKKKNVSKAQQEFLAAIEKAGGIAIVADCLEDVAPYLTRVEVQ